MESLADATTEAMILLVSGDRELWEVIVTSFSVSARAIIFATPFALLLSFALAYGRFPGRQFCVSMFNTLLALPAVVVGLLLYVFLSRAGPLGDWKLLFTQTAMVVGQIILCFPILVAMGHAAIQGGDRRAWETSLTLGASRWMAMLTLFREVRFGLIAAVVAGFGRVIAEVGCSMMVGGNILHFTRNIPTAIALETSKGAFSQGIALGIVLMVMALLLNFLVAVFRGEGRLAV
ncbi:MAG: ABC transporter permease [Gammaproteobacteria bacterium]|nr:ABC transporter permease [Gammaproteobacteria bacterium]MDH3465487.1 ABC transporter permease [Gammaproteobacteria bacterium]